MKRAVATITVYVYGETEEELFNESKTIEQKILSMGDNYASLDKLTTAPFGCDGMDPLNRVEIDTKKFN